MHLAWMAIKDWAWGPVTADALSDSEQAQARLRLGAGLLCWCVVAALDAWGGLGSLGLLQAGLLWYLALGLSWFAVVQAGRGPRRLRLMLAVALEQILYAHILSSAGAQAVWLLGVPAFTALGYGLRYGPPLALFSSAVGLVCLAVGLDASPYWRAMPEVVAGVLLATVAIPVYGAILGRSQVRIRREVELRAAAWEQASKTDPLTGLANRVALMDALERVFSSQRQAARTCALFYVDLDGFKAVNDLAGHAAGDQVLVDVAQALRQSVRLDDVVARLGGDEFAVLTRGVAQADAAEVVAHKVLRALADITVPRYPELRIGGSIGVCLLPDPDVATPHGAVRAADEWMLRVKRAGKGAVMVRAPEQPLQHSA